MFTDSLLQDYCRQIQEIEEKMENFYRDVETRLTNPEYRRFFSRLIEDEQEHQQHLDRLFALLDGK